MKLPIELHKSVVESRLFSSIGFINITRPALFKHGVMAMDIPDKLLENDFDHLQSKIPALEQLIGDYIEFKGSRIINTVSGDRWTTNTSEIVVVGVGLIYSCKLLKINPNRISKVHRPKTRIKYMDYKVIKDGNSIEIETKGTTSDSTAEDMVDDVLLKKANSTASFKFGVITVARKIDDKKPSRLIVCDDPPITAENRGLSFNEFFISHYLDYLSFILDSSQYNRFYAKVLRHNKHPIIPLSKIKGTYNFKGSDYIGEYFDRRLIINNINKLMPGSDNLNSLFKSLTAKIKNVKYFIGVEKRLFQYYNTGDYERMETFSPKSVYEKHGHSYAFRDSDGILIIKSVEGANQQVERNFTEDIVKKRLSLFVDFIHKHPHKCGAPCRSLDKEGKLCDIMTFREHCHFHR